MIFTSRANQLTALGARRTHTHTHTRFYRLCRLSSLSALTNDSVLPLPGENITFDMHAVQELMLIAGSIGTYAVSILATVKKIKRNFPRLSPRRTDAHHGTFIIRGHGSRNIFIRKL